MLHKTLPWEMDNSHQLMDHAGQILFFFVRKDEAHYVYQIVEKSAPRLSSNYNIITHGWTENEHVPTLSSWLDT